MARSHVAALGAGAMLLAALVAVGTKGYGGNASALLHIDRAFGEHYRVPEGLVLYEDGGYDGMLYYQIARNIPQLFLGEGVRDIPLYDQPYRFQRILLPLTAFLLAGGNDGLLPAAILMINVAACLAALAVALKLVGGANVHALVAALNPAALIGILFALSEPLALAATMVFLFSWKKQGEHLRAASIAALSFALFARETTLLLLGALVLASLFRREWREALLALVPLVPFALWQGFLTLRFGALPLATGTHMMGMPFAGVLALLRSALIMPTPYVLSSLALLAFALPAGVLTAIRLQRGGRGKGTIMLGCLFLALFSLDAHIWGTITSVGRVIPALYPVYAMEAHGENTWIDRALSSILLAISIVAAVGVALMRHPFMIS